MGIELNQETIHDYKVQQTNICTIMAYLIGAKEEFFEYYYSNNREILEKLKKNKDAVIIRSLCNIRSNLMINYSNTSHSLVYDMKNLDRQDLYKDDIKILYKNDIDLIKVNYRVNAYIADINKIISERINNLKELFPEWFEWEYIKELFIMPRGQKEEAIKAESLKFGYSRNFYPYTRYIFWTPKDRGNILFNDEKFARVVYEQHNEEFRDLSKVKDASESVKTSIYDFIKASDSVVLVVDCENSDAFKLASVLKQLNTDELHKINKILLYDDIHTTEAWKFLDKVTGIPVEHNLVERIKENKSLVDITMSMGISKEYYRGGVSSFIMLSSDSDFWGVISSLPDANFLVMVERSKCGPDILNALEEHKTYYCYMDDFCTGNIRDFKNAMLLSSLEEQVGNLVQIDTQKLLEDIYLNLRLEATQAEKQNFYNKYIKKMTLTIDKDMIMKIKIPD